MILFKLLLDELKHHKTPNEEFLLWILMNRNLKIKLPKKPLPAAPSYFKSSPGLLRVWYSSIDKSWLNPLLSSTWIASGQLINNKTLHYL